MKKQVFLAASLVLALGFSSCSNKMGELAPDLFKVTPNPLEVKGGNIDATVEGTFPEKYFNKNAVVTVTPVLKYNGTETKGAPKTFQGEKVTGNNQVINQKEGGKFSIPASFKYVPEMAKSELYLDFDIVIKEKAAPEIPQVKVADGVVATEQLAATDANEINPAIIPDKFQRIIQETQEADIKFLIQQSNLRSSETKSQAVADLKAAVKDAKDTENKEIASLNVVGYASPDGALDLNTNLAERRLNTTANFLNREMRKLKADVEIGKLLEQMKQNGIYDDTHFFFLTDHGGIEYGHGGVSTDEMIVPWGLTGPGIAKGLRMTEPNNTVNTAAVILRIFGVEQPKAWTGEVPASIFA